ncbi:nucleoside deaminase [Paenibacillus sinopodophylli]|uniref:nucleoside deaminase n=1 Tax=Paenibacillus sinopodophylli TaxID=1837342 RepID=UPI00110CA339|nr:nucleoside deaminase [Paenibacillus sinopodophylli]
MNQDEFFMKEAIRLSELAVKNGNEPFGAVLVKDGEMVYSNENQIYSATDPTFHAEAGLLRRFCEATQITDLREYTLYSSCEPCFMCSGAIVWTKVGRLVYSASDIDLCNLLDDKGSNSSRIVFENSPHKPDVTAGILREESLRVLASYFPHNSKG